DRPGAVGHRKALLQQRGDLLLTQPLAPARERRAIKRQLVPEHHFPTEVLEIRVLHPPVAQRLVGEVVHVLENEQPGHQPCRQRRLPGSHPTHRAEASRQKVPIDLPRQPHERMTKIDDLLERRAKQVVLDGRRAAGSSFSPDGESRRRRNHEPPKSGIPKRKKTWVHTRLSCKIDYLLGSNHRNRSIASEFFTDDY